MPIHVDLLVVNLQEEMTVDVPVVAVGESAAIDKLGGVLLHLHDRVMVRAKPDDLPSSTRDRHQRARFVRVCAARFRSARACTA